MKRTEHADPPHVVAKNEGTALLAAMLNAAKVLQLYPTGNEAVRRALAEVDERAKSLFAKEGGLTLWLAGKFLFVNDLRVRLDWADAARFSELREMLQRHGIGHIEVVSSVKREDWSAFLSLLGSPPPEGEPALEHALRHLSEAGITRIRIAPPAPLFAAAGGDEALEASRQSYARSVKAIRDVMSSAVFGKALGSGRVERAVVGIVDRVLEDKASMLGMITLRDYDDHLFTHSVNVSILAVALGEQLGFSKDRLFELGLAALFHDIGKVLVPSSVLNKRGWLNDDEWQQLNQHPEFGLLMLFNVKGFAEPPFRAMLAAYEHHMKPDLSGYPRVIRRRRQGLFAKMIAVVEAYDVAISPHNRQFIPASPDQAIQQLCNDELGSFDRVVVKAFANMMGLYPVGSLAILDSGEMGVVVARSPNPRALNRPLVRLIADAGGTRIPNGPIIDLTDTDPATGRPRRSIARCTDPERYNLKISDHVA